MGLGSFGNTHFSSNARLCTERAASAREEWIRLSELISSTHNIQRGCLAEHGNWFIFKEYLL
jgi:hypothetical protein